MNSSLPFDSRRGMSAIPFIVMLILFLAAGYAAYSFYTDLETAKSNLANAQQKESTARARAITAENAAKKVADMVGFRSAKEGAPVDPVSITTMRTDLAKKLADVGKYGVNLADEITLETLIDRLQTALDAKVAANEVLAADLVKKDTELAAAATAREEAVNIITQQKTQVETERDAASKESAENNSKFEAEAKRRRDDVTALTEVAQEQAAAAVKAERTLKDEIAFVKADFDQLKIKEEVVHERAQEMDGKIIDADVESNFALIDIGKKDGLFQGTRFDVIRIIRGNVERMVGVIEVRKTFDRYAECSVVSVADPLNPLLPEDRIRNEVYDPERVREFVFAGTVANSRYSSEEIGRMIENFGGKLVAATTQSTDVVILGAGYVDDDNYKRALELRIVSMSEQELLRQLGR